jgi:DNA-binding CsgD family transcriptional regulator
MKEAQLTQLNKIIQIDAIFTRLDKASVLSDLQPIIEDLRDGFRVDHMVYHWVNAKGAKLGVGTYSQDWIERYLEKGYLRIDPVILGCAQHFHPVDWKNLDWSAKAARQFQQDAISFGVGNQGMSIPIRGPQGQYALFSVSHNCRDDQWLAFITDNRRNLILLAHYFNKKVLEIEGDRIGDARAHLSPREIEALTLLALGYNRAQVAQTMTISEHTLRAYIESGRHKLGAMNTVHAVACAINAGMIIV